MIIPIITLLVVFVLIAVRKIGRVNLKIWYVMLFGALVVIVTRQIPVSNALESINLDVMLFLFGMFIVGQAIEESGYLSHLAYKAFKKSRNINHLVLLVLFGMGLASAFLMNDTLAIIGTPVVLLLARKHRINPKILLLALAFAITIGSVTSPIGNPQNLLVAVNSSIKNPFVTFFKFLLIPTLVNLFIAYAILKFFFKTEFHQNHLEHSQEPIKDHKLAILSKISLILIILLVFAKIVTVFLGLQSFRLTYIALGSALPVVLFSPRRFEILKKIDWATLVFFASMFILMESVWDSGFFQPFINNSGSGISSIIMIFVISVTLSQFISNVPLVALYLPMLLHTNVSTEGLMALAAGSTIAGNLSILGAASNVIIIQNAEKKSGETLSFLEFVRIGIPLTIANILVYWLFFNIF